MEPPPDPDPSPGPDSDPSVGNSWDQAREARRIAKGGSRRTTRKKKRRRDAADWDETGDQSGDGNPRDIEKELIELEKQLKSQAPKPTGRRRRLPRISPHLQVAVRRISVALVSVFLLALVAHMAIQALRPPDAKTNPAPASPSPVQVLPTLLPKNQIEPVASPPPPKRIVIASDDPQFEALRAMLTDFLTTTSIEKKLSLLRPTPDVKNHLEASLQHPAINLKIAPTFGPAFVVSGDFVYAEIIEAGIGVRGAIVEKSGDRYLLDFDSFIGYSSADWGAISELKFDAPVTTRALLRIVPDAPVSTPGNSIVHVTDPDQNYTLNATVKLLGIRDQSILSALSTGRLLPFIITMAPAEQTASNRAEIEQIHFAGWFEKNLFN